MRIVYYDESGDDGYPAYSSPVFVFSAVYVHHLGWKDLYDTIRDFRRQLKDDYGFPVKMEMHSRHFLLNKNPYKEFRYDDTARLEIFSKFCELIGSTDLRIINVAILKSLIKSPNYDVLDTALKYSIQRIENDIDPVSNPNEKFMVITDSGRVGKMRKTTRRIQKINYIPSKFSGGTYRKEIRALIEDPLPKDSKQSYFIQLADVVAQTVYYYSILSKGIKALPSRLGTFVDQSRIEAWLDLMEPSLNLKAAPSEHYGIKYHPN